MATARDVERAPPEYGNGPRPSWLGAAVSAVARLLRDHRALLLLLCAGVVLRVAVNDVARYSPGDEAHYRRLASALLSDGWGTYPALVRSHLLDRAQWVLPSPGRWGYLAMAALTCAVRAPCDERALAWLSTVAGVASIALTYAVGARLLGKRAGLVAAALTVTSPLQLALGRRALQDEVLCAVFLAALWAFVRMLSPDPVAPPAREAPPIERDGAQPADEGDPRRPSRGAVAAFIALATLAFAVKETFAVPYVAFVVIAVLAPRGRPFGLRDALVLAAPPALAFLGFVLSSRDAGAFFELLAAGQQSFLSKYSAQQQSGPPHRPLFDLFVLAPGACLLAAFAAALMIARREIRAGGGERWLFLVLVVTFVGFMGLPKNVRFVIVLDPIVRLLAAWALVTILDARRLSPRWAVPAVAANAAAELAIFHATFVAENTYDPTTQNVLRALDALPRPTARAAPSAWPEVFFAASALAIAALFLTRRRTVTKIDDRDEEAEGAKGSGDASDAGSKEERAAARDEGGADPKEERAAAPQGGEKTAEGAVEGEGAKAAAGQDAAGNGSSGKDHVATIAIAVACVVVALFIGRSCQSPATQADPAAATTAAPGSDPAAEHVNAGLAATSPNQAVVHFRKALEITPQHYGATFQLARALDGAGRKDEALAQWRKVLALAEQSNDQPLVEMARARIAQGSSGGGSAPQGDPMAAGLEALYGRKDPAAAAARFREVLTQNPDHYGATYQLATALEASGDARGARAVWQRMSQMADAIQDAQTAETARARLAEIDRVLGAQAPPDPDAAEMNAGLAALYTEKDPAKAITHFRKVLDRNADHYGATYQLATALDQAKKPAEARPRWEKVLKMAEAIQDTQTADAARTRLAQKP